MALRNPTRKIFGISAKDRKNQETRKEVLIAFRLLWRKVLFILLSAVLGLQQNFETQDIKQVM